MARRAGTVPASLLALLTPALLGAQAVLAGIIAAAGIADAHALLRPDRHGHADRPVGHLPAAFSSALLAPAYAAYPALDSLLRDPSHPEWTRPAPPVSRLRFETSKGIFVLELIREWGPIGADRLYNLVRLGYYDNTRFHRVNRGYIVQWGLHGDPAVNAAWKDQFLRDDPPRSNNVRGTFAFSYMGPGREHTRNTQIYINLGDNTRNDGEPFTVLGRVIEGMDVLDSLYAGYGETSGSGVRQGRQGPLEQGGNAYMDREFPLLDRIYRAVVGGAVSEVGW